MLGRLAFINQSTFSVKSRLSFIVAQRVIAPSRISSVPLALALCSSAFWVINIAKPLSKQTIQAQH